MLVIGTSGLVHPAAGLPDLARRSGATTIEINVEPTPLSDSMDIVLRGPSGVVLPALCTRTDSGVSTASPILFKEVTMQMKQGEQYACKKCGCKVTVTVAPTVAGKGGQGSLVCCGEKMSEKP